MAKADAPQNPRAAARAVELKRQADVRKAVDHANATELPQLGGPTPADALVSHEGEGTQTSIGSKS